MSAQGQRGAHDVQFGFVASAADAPGTSDAELYRTVLEDVEWHAELGYSTAWFIEHHFSDYFPTPSPVVLMSHLAARFPQLELGTCVLVLPWYDPLRLAGEIAMLSLLTERPLHFGIGRGTAKYEFDAFGLDMGASRQHFAEAYEVISRALSGERFSFDGEHVKVPREVGVRPRVAGVTTDRINFYGAIGSPGTASVMADIGLPPMCTTIGDYGTQVQILETWRERTRERGLLDRRHVPDHDQLHRGRHRRGGHRRGTGVHPAVHAGASRPLHARRDGLGAAGQLPGVEGAVRRNEADDRPREHPAVDRVPARRARPTPSPSASSSMSTPASITCSSTRRRRARRRRCAGQWTRRFALEVAPRFSLERPALRRRAGRARAEGLTAPRPRLIARWPETRARTRRPRRSCGGGPARSAQRPPVAGSRRRGATSMRTSRPSDRAIRCTRSRDVRTSGRRRRVPARLYRPGAGRLPAVVYSPRGRLAARKHPVS